MLFTVSTVKETIDGLERMVSRNLASGVDHLVVFVDDADPDALAWLAAQPHATGIGTDARWWGGRRPDQLNARQKINANLTRAALAALPEATWVFHVDGDEVVVADRAALAALPDDVAVVHAPPLEAVSRREWPEQRVTSFKRLLTEDELELLVLLGALDKPRNEVYFHGHVKGKSGMRPSLDLWFSLHEVADAAGEDVDPGDAAAVRLLHYESFSYAEFVRKWTNILGSGTLPAFRGNRLPTARAIGAVLAKELPEDARERSLGRIYERVVEDDLDLLGDLGLLVAADPDAPGGHVPQPLPETARRRLDAVLAALGEAPDKRVFRTGETAEAGAAELARAVDALRASGLPGGEVDDVRSRWGETSRGRLAGGLRRLRQR